MIFILFASLFSCESDYDIVPRLPDIDPSEITACDFVPIANSRLSRYRCNPIFPNTNDQWSSGIGSVSFHVTEVLGHPFYQIWYVQYNEDESFYGLGYAVSDNGIDWTPHPSNPLIEKDPSAWDQDYMGSQVVFWDSLRSEYVMAYQGVTFGADEFSSGTWGLGIATSPNGVEWAKSADNPVLNFIDDFSYDAEVRPCWPLTLRATESGYTGYVSASIMGSNGSCQMYEYFSPDLVNWQVYSESPVLYTGFSYDRMGFSDATVVEWVDPQTEEKSLYMFYVGFSDVIDHQGYYEAKDTSLGLAISYDDGQTWEKHQDNPLPVNLTTVGEISSIGARVIGSRIHLWVGDQYNDTGAIGYFYYEPGIAPH